MKKWIVVPNKKVGDIEFGMKMKTAQSPKDQGIIRGLKGRWRRLLFISKVFDWHYYGWQ